MTCGVDACDFRHYETIIDERSDLMRKTLLLLPFLALSACGGLGEPSPGLTTTYDQSTSRAAYDNITARNCAGHGCLPDHVSGIRTVTVARPGISYGIK